MECPYCHNQTVNVENSRPTRHRTQIWRRRHCTNCNSDFTTHEIIDLSHLMVIKKNGRTERFSRMKLYSGIYGSTIGSKTPNREFVVDKITREVEQDLLFLKVKTISTEKISDIVLLKLRKLHTSSFLRFLAYSKNITNESQMKKELSKYTT